MTGPQIVLRGALGSRLPESGSRPESVDITATGATYDEALAALQVLVREGRLLLHMLRTDG